MDEQALVVAKTPLPNDLSDDDLQPKVPVEEVKVAPTKKKKSHKKKLKKSDVMETKVESPEDAAPFVPEFVPPAASIDLFAVPNYPAKLLSLSIELFAPFELYAQSSLRSDCHGVRSSVLLIQIPSPECLSTWRLKILNLLTALGV
jgi:hypothetical protein